MNKQINFPVEMDDYNLEKVFLSHVYDSIGVIATSTVEGELIVLRLYEVNRFEGNDTFEIVKELEAFGFTNREKLNEFVEKLPEMGAIDMLLLLHQNNPTI